jgi:thymidylate synthase (FAD)
MKMRLINASAVIERATPDLEECIEAAGRTCWKSDDKIEPGSAGPFIERIKGFKHDSVLEHGAITVRFIVDRGVSHELVRHRMASFSQESTRYCNYGKDKHGNEVSFIDPRPAFPAMGDSRFVVWEAAMLRAEDYYLQLLGMGAPPQEARDVLPNSVKTEVVMTVNPREWRHVFRMRCDRAAHPQMREVMIPLWKAFSCRWPALFADIEFAQ